MRNVSRRERPQVKALNGVTMMCEAPGCGRSASYIFRAGRGPITVYCDYHASETATRQGIELPESCEKVLRAGW